MQATLNLLFLCVAFMQLIKHIGTMRMKLFATMHFT